MAYSLPAHDVVHIGTFVKTPAPQIIEILGTTSLDFAILDAEHAPLDRAALDLALLAGRAARLPLMVRVPDWQAPTILSVLDMGAAGVLVPHVDDANQARQVVVHSRYRTGDRGYSGSPRAAGYGTLGMKEALRLGDQSVVMCQIESAQAVEEAGHIAAVSGVDGLFIGRADLALSMGLEDSNAPRVIEATEHVIRCGTSAGKIVGMFVGSTRERERFAPLGVRWFVHGSDQALLRQAAQAIARTNGIRSPG